MTTEGLILKAATEVFTRNGFAGTRTEDIARQAGINRALLHYYYRDKESIFNIIFEDRFKEFFNGLFVIFQADSLSFFDKVHQMINHEITTLLNNPDMARFVVMEIARQPERLMEYGKKLGINPRLLIERFEAQTQNEINAGRIRPIEGKQLLITIMSTCIYPFIAQPIIQTMMQLDDQSFKAMMETRKKEIYELIIHGIKV